MDATQFWSIIEAGGQEADDDPERQLSAIRGRLRTLPPEEVRDFQRLFNRMMADAYDWDLWGAAYLINGGCSDDGFAYFRAWLISRGREVYEPAVRVPDSLAGLTDPARDDYELEDLWYIAHEVYRELTGEEMPPVELPEPQEPRGERWDHDDDAELALRFPKLSRVYLT
jgi:Protein of unknown function (DUF4240)